MSRDVGDLNVIYTRTQIERQLLPHNRKLLIVNGQGWSVALLLFIFICSPQRLELRRRSQKQNYSETHTSDLLSQAHIHLRGAGNWFL
jgi:hypothetical protein